MTYQKTRRRWKLRIIPAKGVQQQQHTTQSVRVDGVLPMLLQHFGIFIVDVSLSDMSVYMSIYLCVLIFMCMCECVALCVDILVAEIFLCYIFSSLLCVVVVVIRFYPSGERNPSRNILFVLYAVIAYTTYYLFAVFRTVCVIFCSTILHTKIPFEFSSFGRGAQRAVVVLAGTGSHSVVCVFFRYFSRCYFSFICRVCHGFFFILDSVQCSVFITK